MQCQSVGNMRPYFKPISFSARSSAKTRPHDSGDLSRRNNATIPGQGVTFELFLTLACSKAGSEQMRTQIQWIAQVVSRLKPDDITVLQDAWLGYQQSGNAAVLKRIATHYFPKATQEAQLIEGVKALVLLLEAYREVSELILGESSIPQPALPLGGNRLLA